MLMVGEREGPNLRLLDSIRTFITVKLDLPLLGLLLQRLVHLTTRSKLKDEIDPERKSC